MGEETGAAWRMGNVREVRGITDAREVRGIIGVGQIRGITGVGKVRGIIHYRRREGSRNYWCLWRVREPRLTTLFSQAEMT